MPWLNILFVLLRQSRDAVETMNVACLVRKDAPGQNAGIALLVLAEHLVGKVGPLLQIKDWDVVVFASFRHRHRVGESSVECTFPYCSPTAAVRKNDGQRFRGNVAKQRVMLTSRTKYNYWELR